ncbi:RNA ligase family protein [Bacillus horti]|uniref:DNA ligase (ATP) n=1 Tax=Caldalkalibacillus horti TaxID=77523 RepID=A0ABT9VXF7_9BACI|nr:RNA ligase family protein [Bacillus horti]MDQ0165676.1 bifunctional non-homologous end joining protein LigD [Bacillus horti]
MDIRPITPFEPISTDVIPEGENWVYQVKWDGTRVLTYYDGVHTRLYNRRLNEKTMQYPELTDLSSYCTASSVILDGEIIALENGKPSFHAVMKRDHLKDMKKIERVRTEVPISYMIFDILYCDGEWVTNKSLEYRQSLLERIILLNKHVQLVPSYENAIQLWKTVENFNLEGIVCKDLNSLYLINHKNNNWQKKKHYKDLIAVVGGVTLRNGVVNALILGLYDRAGQLSYIGHAGTGKLKHSDWRQLTKIIQPLVLDQRPFINKPERDKDAVWIKPKITVKIQYIEWTEGRSLRQPSIQAFVNVSPEECVWEEDMHR